MKPTIAALLICVAASPLHAQSARRPLDLRLHPREVPAPVSTAPGVYYGDVGGGGGGGVEEDTPTDKATEVHGGISTSIGYSKGFGTGVSTAAHVDVSHRLDNGGRVDVHVGVRRGDGFPATGAYGYPGPYPYGD